LDAIDAVVRKVNREVWIVTAAAGEQRGGLAATWVSQASIDVARPTVAIAIAVNHFTRELIDASQAFALHLIDEGQVDLVWRFAIGSGRDRDKLAGIESTTRATGSPVLGGVQAWLDCRVHDRYDGGDRIYYWADVLEGRVERAGDPLCEHELFALASGEHKAALKAGLLADVEIQRPLYDDWRKEKAK
jgi:flavin reductase (DIM6/NTAB) family NADH-FMN oxidoreductase RutF